MEHVYMGIDVGKKFCFVCVLNEEGERIHLSEIPTLEEAAWRKLLLRFQKVELHVCFEIGTHYEWMYDLLRQNAADVQVVNPEAFALIARSQKKTDKIDCQKLAEGLRRGDLPLVYVPEKRVREDRRLASHIHALSRLSTSIKNRIRNLLFMARLECKYTSLERPGAIRWLKEIALPSLGDTDRLVLNMLLEQLELIAAQQQQIGKTVTERLKNYSDVTLVRSIPGFGPLVSLSVLCAIAEIGRFETPDQLASYFGLCGRTHQSGASLYQGYITKRGNKHVRWLLGQSVTLLIRADPKARARYMKLRRKKRPKIARVALMRWISTVLWRMLKKREEYRINGVAGAYRRKKAA